ncbi:M56 family metallopeptidase [Neolewinella aurantiaca]|uniref:M56 family metallopeptidase n=1 Tax=Neolewinella aurantiaca TaxID=2602767 RepID=A0A5C7FL76_9BACT|nr:M56 family metallopeptidase [Neolewinella aurantiaca]TXF90793.1 M56 family metallopeptidase [Neolewinella aurantiaca]
MMTYLFTSSVLLFVFAAGYYVFLLQSPPLALRRRVLLLGILGAVVLPLLPAPSFPAVLSSGASPEQVVEGWVTYEIAVDATVATNVPAEEFSGAAAGAASGFSPVQLITIAYLLGALLFLGKIVFGLIRLRRIRRKSQSTGEVDIRILAGRGEAFTFGRTVYLSQAVYDSVDAPVIIAHERAHAEQLHTADALLAESLRAIFWFHPLAWWLRDQVQLNLEYLADAAVLRAGYNRRAYQLSLVAHQQGTDFKTSLLPQFAAKGLKQRIRMMGFSPGSVVRSLSAVAAIVFLGFLAFACVKGDGVENMEGESLSGTWSKNEAMELNLYFKRLPTPAEVAKIRPYLKDYFDKDLLVYQSCSEPEGTYTFAPTSSTSHVSGVALTNDYFSLQPRHFQFVKSANGGTGSAIFRPAPVPDEAPDEDIFLNINGEWIPVFAEDKGLYSANNLTSLPRSEEVNCQLGLTPETKVGFNVSTSTYSISNNSSIRGAIDGANQAGVNKNIVVNKSYFYGSEEINQETFIERADESRHVFTVAKRVGASEIFVVFRLDPV